MSTVFTNPNLDAVDEAMREWYIEESYGRMIRAARNIVLFAIEQDARQKALMEITDYYRNKDLDH